MNPNGNGNGIDIESHATCHSLIYLYECIHFIYSNCKHHSQLSSYNDCTSILHGTTFFIQRQRVYFCLSGYILGVHFLCFSVFYSMKQVWSIRINILSCLSIYLEMFFPLSFWYFVLLSSSLNRNQRSKYIFTQENQK